MNSNALFITLLSSAVFMTGGVRGQNSNQDLKDAKNKIEGAAESVKNYTFTEKDEFVSMMKRKLDGINRSLDKIDAQADKSGADTKAEAKTKVDALRVKVSQLGEQVDAAKHSTESTWDRVKTDTENACKKLKSEVRNADRWSNEKISR